MIIKAWPFADVRIGAIGKNFSDKVQGLFYFARRGIRSEVFSGFLPGAAGALYFARVANLGNFRRIINLDESVIFIIPQHDIVGRQILFDERVFQKQRFQFGIDHGVVKVLGFGHKERDLLASIMPKILRRARAQIFGLTHINDPAALVLEQIHARSWRQVLYFFFKLGHMTIIFISETLCHNKARRIAMKTKEEQERFSGLIFVGQVYLVALTLVMMWALVKIEIESPRMPVEEVVTWIFLGIFAIALFLGSVVGIAGTFEQVIISRLKAQGHA